jgi:predicted double-glycine peptidase
LIRQPAFAGQSTFAGDASQILVRAEIKTLKRLLSETSVSFGLLPARKFISFTPISFMLLIMNPGLGATAAALFAATGSLLGYLFSRLPKPYWLLGYLVPLALILVYGMAVHHPVLSFMPPVSWMMLERKKFAVMGFVAAMVLTTPLSRLPLKRDRLVVGLLAVIIVFLMSVWPFLAPLFNRQQLEHLQTRMGNDGVCRQSTDYTCGPAAAVTALRKLGLPAQEGEIAILSGTSSTTGTSPDILAETLQQEYGKDGLTAKYRYFDKISELKQAGLTLAVIKFNFLLDHYVTVLKVTDSAVIVGDPLNGLEQMSYADFSRKWRFVGVVLKRKWQPRILPVHASNSKTNKKTRAAISHPRLQN